MYSTPKAVTRDQVKDATEEDPALQALKKYINQGWIDTNDTRTHEFRQVFHELTIVAGVVLRAHVWFPGMDSQCDKFVSTYLHRLPI